MVRFLLSSQDRLKPPLVLSSYVQESQASASLKSRGEVGLLERGLSTFEVLGDIAEKSDTDYFAFTAKNLFESEHAFWYANWTMTRQKDPRWAEIGEWKLFAIDYFQTRNLECGSFWIDCKDMPGLSDIQALYPNDRVLARRVYFTSECYLIIRNYLKAIQTILDEVNLSLYGLIPEIVHTFTSRPKPSAQLACAIIGVVVDTLVNVGITAATGMMSSTVTSFYDKMKGSVAQATHDAEVASRWYTKIMTSKMMPNQVVNWLRSQDVVNAWGEITPENTAVLESLSERVGKLFSAVPRSDYPAHSRPELVPGLQKTKDAYLKAKKTFPWIKPVTQVPANLRMGLRFSLQSLVRDQMRLHLGSSSLGGPGVCSRFDGGDVDNSVQNIDQVQGHLASVFPQILESLSDLYEGIYNGSIQEEGSPSWLAVSMLNHNWAEESSYLERLRHGGLMKREIMRAFTLNIASQVSASDGSYMKCTHKPWAQKKCEQMARAKPTDEAALGYFCPRPDSDPTLICQVGRWSLSHVFSHEMPWPALLKIENFAGNRFELTRLELLKSAYDHYVVSGNDLSVDWESWFLGPLSSLSGLTMPVCQHDDLAMKDNTVHGPGHKGKGKNSLAVPNVCGINGSETEKFFTEVGFLEGSDAWNSQTKYEHRAGGGTNELYNDRLIRANQDMFKNNPFMRYTTMCHQHIRFREHRESIRSIAINIVNYLRVKKGRDQDCDLVLNATRDMSPDVGNRWFCQKHREYGMDYGHTIFSREIWRVTDWVKTHKHECKVWLHQHGKGFVSHVPAIPGLPRPKTGKRLSKAQERKRLRQKKKAEKAASKKLEKAAELTFKKSLKSMSKKEAKAAKKRHKQQLKEAKKLRKKKKNH
ncbi:hypothetical protein EPUL_003899, partial [Erysiphe pulchra]